MRPRASSSRIRPLKTRARRAFARGARDARRGALRACARSGAIPTPVIGKLAEALAAKMNERDLDLLLANLKDVMEHGEKSVAVEARPH
jgi:hypothetical protein